MPTYTFRNKDDGSVVELEMKISEREKYLTDNPLMEQIHLTMPGFGDVVRLGLRKPDDTFRDILKERARKNPKSTINTL